MACRTSNQARSKGLEVLLIQSNIRSLSLLKFPYLSGQLFDKFIRGPVRKNLNAHTCFFVYNSYKNSSGLFALLFRYFPTKFPPKLFIAVFTLCYLFSCHSCFHLALLSKLCLPRFGFSTGHECQPIGDEYR